MLKKFLKGLGYNFKGVQYFLQNRDLWKYLIVPYILNFLLATLLVSLYVYYFDELFLFFSKYLKSIDVENPVGIWQNIWDGVLWIFRNLFKIFLFLLTVVLLFSVLFLFSLVINSPFYEKMSEVILSKENYIIEKNISDQGLWQNIIYTITFEIKHVLLFFPISILFILLGFIPLIGYFFVLIQFIFTAWIFSFSVCSLPMIFSKETFATMLRWAYSNKSKLIGFGLPSLIPFVGFFIVGLQVPGATLLYIDTQKRDGYE